MDGCLTRHRTELKPESTEESQNQNKPRPDHPSKAIDDVTPKASLVMTGGWIDIWMYR